MDSIAATPSDESSWVSARGLVATGSSTSSAEPAPGLVVSGLIAGSSFEFDGLTLVPMPDPSLETPVASSAFDLGVAGVKSVACPL
jgi:hypothetical protein